MSQVCQHLALAAHVLKEQHDSSSGKAQDNLGRCGRTAGTMWSLLGFTEDWDAMFKFPRPQDYMKTRVKLLHNTPKDDMFHVVGLSLVPEFGNNDHQLVVVFASNDRAYSVQSNNNHFGPRLTSLGSSSSVIAAMSYLIDHGETEWDASYICAYERFACMCTEGSPEAMSRGVGRYATALTIARTMPGRPRTKTPVVNLVVRLNKNL